MNQSFREKIAEKPRILVAPLDWGLGHATRCIPIIRELLAQNCDVCLAGEGAQEHLLKTEFPELPFLQLPGYRIKYARTQRGLIWKMIQQGPKMRRAIQYEHRWLKKMIKQHHFDAVISDNRYGLYHSTIPCIFITHQLTIKSSLAKWTEKILQKKNYSYINKFTACWVPDLPAGQAGVEGPAYRTGRENNLAGELSHPETKPAVPVHYIGFLSRFERKAVSENKNNLLIVLSGLEPQRSMLEEKIIKDIGEYNHTATIVRGLPGVSSLIPSTNRIQFYNHLSSGDLNAVMQEAEYVISRSGYSSIMDIIALQKKAVLIPTPGQTEQEYLGNYLMKKEMAVCIAQKDFSLQEALVAASSYQYKIPATLSLPLLSATIETFLVSISLSTKNKSILKS